MNINKKLAALMLISASALTTQANAAQSGLEQVVSHIVGNAVNNVSMEIDQQVQKITLTASNMMSISSTNDTVGKVTITDIATNNLATTKQETLDKALLKNKTSSKNNGENTLQEQRANDA